MKRLVVYVAGPYTSGDHLINVMSYIYTATKLIDAGFAPVMPFLSNYVEAWWMEIDFATLEKCDAFIRLDTYTPSKGADREEQHAKELHIPVFHTLQELRFWRDNLLKGEKYA